MNIANRIKQLRTENGYTQKQLSDKIGLTPKMISFYESGERVPPIDILLKFVQIFNVSSDYLLGLTDERCPQEEYSWRYSTVSNRLGYILNVYRQRNNLSEQDFAKKLQLNMETYVGIETGKYIPTYEILQKISEFTQYDIDYLTGATDHTSTPTNETFEISGKNFPMFIAEGNTHFKTRFEELCLQKSVNQSNVEKYLGLDKQTFTDIRWNRMPTLPEILKISYAFSVSIDYLVGKTDTPITNLSSDELELLLNYRDCIEPYKENIRKRTESLSIASLDNVSVAADSPLKRTGTDTLGKSSPSSGTEGDMMIG